MKNNVMSKLGNVKTQVIAKGKKHSPELLLAAGLVCGVTTVLAACKGTIKAKAILEDSKETLEFINGSVKVGEVSGNEYTEEDGDKDTKLVYIQTGAKLVKTYMPTVVMGSLTVVCVLASHDILKKRNVALSAAYTAIDGSFKEYRDRVVERFGEDIDKELRYNIVSKKFEEIDVDEKTGKEKKSKKNVPVADPNLTSDYACYFDERSRNFEKASDYNLMFLRSQESHFNDYLQVRGHVFLNEVYDALDLPRTAAGQIVGWTSDGPDGYIDLRITEVEVEDDKGHHTTKFIIDPNVQGDVWSRL